MGHFSPPSRELDKGCVEKTCRPTPSLPLTSVPRRKGGVPIVPPGQPPVPQPLRVAAGSGARGAAPRLPREARRWQAAAEQRRLPGVRGPGTIPAGTEPARGHGAAAARAVPPAPPRGRPRRRQRRVASPAACGRGYRVKKKQKGKKNNLKKIQPGVQKGSLVQLRNCPTAACLSYGS